MVVQELPMYCVFCFADKSTVACIAREGERGEERSTSHAVPGTGMSLTWYEFSVLCATAKRYFFCGADRL